jgi:hypothetical protein
MKTVISRAALVGILTIASFCGAQAGSTINPAVPGSTYSDPLRGNFAAAYNDINNVLGEFAGATAPVSPTTYQFWADTSTTPPTIRQFDGAQWVAIGSLDPTSHAWNLKGDASAVTVTATGGPGSYALKDLVFLQPSSGTPQAIYGNYVPKLHGGALGSVASPVTTTGPIVKLSQVDNRAPGVCGNSFDAECSTTLAVYTTGTKSTDMMMTAIYAGAKGSLSPDGDILGISSVGYSTAGNGRGTGLYLEGRTDADVSVMGGATASEFRITNGGSATAGYNTTGESALTGLWLTYGAYGCSVTPGCTHSDASAGIQLGLASSLNPGQWLVGYGITVGAVRNQGFRDDSADTTVLYSPTAHTNGVDFSGGTFSGCAFKSTGGFCVDGSGRLNPGATTDIGDDATHNGVQIVPATTTNGATLRAAGVDPSAILQIYSGGSAPVRLGNVTHGNSLILNDCGGNCDQRIVMAGGTGTSAASQINSQSITSTAGSTPLGLVVTAQSASTMGDGGLIQISSGNGNATGLGGEARLIGGNGGATGNGGPVKITAGNGGATTGNGGSITLTPGAVTSGTPGTITFAGVTKYASSTTGAGTQTFTNSPCGALTTARWIPIQITDQTGTWYIAACQ